MSAFTDGVVFYTGETVEEDGALTTVNGVERGIENCGTDTETEGGACNVREE